MYVQCDQVEISYHNCALDYMARGGGALHQTPLFAPNYTLTYGSGNLKGRRRYVFQESDTIGI